MFVIVFGTEDYPFEGVVLPHIQVECPSIDRYQHLGTVIPGFKPIIDSVLAHVTMHESEICYKGEYDYYHDQYYQDDFLCHDG